MTMQTTKNLPTREQLAELSRKARAFYEPLREKLEKEHWGEYITIHPETGDHAISSNHGNAVKEMREKFPGILFYTIRIGYRAFGHFGGRGASDGRPP
jgi:glutamate formiminotransferase